MSVRRVPAPVLLPALAFGVVLVMVLNVSTGALHVNGLDVVRTIADHLGIGDAGDVPRAARTVVWDVRLPRTLLSLLVGAGLAMAGAALQGIYRNPLADPGIIGVSSGAALGAVGVIVLGFGALGYGPPRSPPSWGPWPCPRSSTAWPAGVPAPRW